MSAEKKMYRGKHPAKLKSFFERYAREHGRDPENRLVFPDYASNPLGHNITRLMEMNPFSRISYTVQQLDEMSDDQKSAIIVDFILSLKIMWRNQPMHCWERTEKIVQGELLELEKAREFFEEDTSDAGSVFQQRMRALNRELAGFNEKSVV